MTPGRARPGPGQDAQLRHRRAGDAKAGAHRGDERRPLGRDLPAWRRPGRLSQDPRLQAAPTPCSSWRSRQGARDALAALEAVEVDYPRRGAALGPVHLALEPGEIVALVGPSGCGKSHGAAAAGRAGAADARASRARTPGRGETSVVFQAPTLMPWAERARPTSPCRWSWPASAAAEARGQAPTQPWPASAWRAPRRPSRPSFPAAWPCGRRWPAPWSPSPSCCCSTSPSRRWTRSPAAPWPTTSSRSGPQRSPAIVFVTHNVEEAVYMAAPRRGDDRRAPAASPARSPVDGAPAPAGRSSAPPQAFRDTRRGGLAACWRQAMAA